MVLFYLLLFFVPYIQALCPPFVEKFVISMLSKILILIIIKQIVLENRITEHFSCRI